MIKINLDVSDEFLINCMKEIINNAVEVAITGGIARRDYHAISEEFTTDDLLDAIELSNAANRIIEYCGGNKVYLSELIVKFENERANKAMGDESGSSE